MDPSNQDLWPDDIAEPEDRAPVMLLREQAAALGRKTRNLLVGEVITKPHNRGAGEELRIFFHIVAPVLQGYRYVLFTIVQPVEGYPLEIEFNGQSQRIEDERGLRDAVSSILAHDHTKRVVRSLIAQCRE